MLLGDLELVRALLALGAGANAQRVKPDGSGDRTTPLFWVCWGVHREFQEAICRLLLEAGADATARNAYSDTPLHWAAERCNLAVCRQLLDAVRPANSELHEALYPCYVIALSKLQKMEALVEHEDLLHERGQLEVLTRTSRAPSGGSPPPGCCRRRWPSWAARRRRRRCWRSPSSWWRRWHGLRRPTPDGAP